jgi:hypothetical protein
VHEYSVSKSYSQIGQSLPQQRYLLTRRRKWPWPILVAAHRGKILPLFARARKGAAQLGVYSRLQNQLRLLSQKKKLWAQTTLSILGVDCGLYLSPVWYFALLQQLWPRAATSSPQIFLRHYNTSLASLLSLTSLHNLLLDYLRALWLKIHFLRIFPYKDVLLSTYISREMLIQTRRRYLRASHFTLSAFGVCLADSPQLFILTSNISRIYFIFEITSKTKLNILISDESISTFSCTNKTEMVKT